MAGLDTSIALGIKPVDFGDPNEGRMNALRAQMMQMQMQQGQFNMMKAQRDMQYQDQQRAAAAAATARDRAAEKEAINAFLKTAQPGSAFNPNPNTPYAPDDASAEGSGMFPGWNNAQPPDMNATIQQLVNAGKFDAAKKMMGQNQAFNVNTESNLKVKKDTATAAEAGSKAASAEIELFNKQYAPHRAALVNVTSPEEAAAWTSSMYDQPTFGDMMKKLGMSKEQATAQSAQKFAENPQAWIVSQMNLDGEKAHKLVYGEGKEGKKTNLALAQSERQALIDQLAKDPTNKAIQDQIAQYDNLISKETKPPADPTAPIPPNSRLFLEQTVKHEKDQKALSGVLQKTDRAAKKIDALLSPENEKWFANHYGGYDALVTSKYSGKTADVGSEIESIQSDLKAAGLEMMRAGGAIGAMALQEWPIVSNLIASLSPTMSVKGARDKYLEIQATMRNIADNAKETYTGTWGQTQFYKPDYGYKPISDVGGKTKTPANNEVIDFNDLGKAKK